MSSRLHDLSGAGRRPGPRWGIAPGTGAWALSGLLVLALGTWLAVWPRLSVAAPGGPRLSVSDVYMRVPASPDVATVYLTIHNDGGTADTLESVTTPDAASAQLHGEVRQGGTESMQALSTLPIPARGQAALSVGADHLMPLNPRSVQSGDRITLVLHFAASPPLTVPVPVVGLLDPAPQG